MLRYLLNRVLMLIPLFFGITLITFVVIHLAPGEPVEMQTALNPKASAKSRERLREFYGLDKPLHIQYVQWLGRLAKLDFGRSFAPGRQTGHKKGCRADPGNTVDKLYCPDS